MTKTLFIGLDGATFTLLDALTAEQADTGVVMPFLKQFLETGVRAKLRSTPNPLTPPAWVSLMTGRSPGNHGVFDFIRAEERGEDVFFTLFDARDTRVETIWSIASRQGRSVVALNFPMTAPPKPINGSLVPGFVPWKHLRRNSYPETLYDRLKGLDGFDPKELAWDFDREKQAMEELSPEDSENWVRYHLPREEQWFQIARYLLQEDQPDLMAVMFDGTDKIQHQAWQFLDPALVKTDPNDYERRMRQTCLEYFQRLDTYLARLVETAGPDTQVFMASDHGFTQTVEVVRINAYLADKGYLAWKPDDGSDAFQRREASMFANLDWSNTYAYCSTPSSNGITIRVAHAEGETGIAASEYESFRDRLIRDLEAFTDTATGERIIRAIHKREDVFAGDAMADAPDLLLELRDYGFVSVRNAQPIVQPREHPAGTHHPDGIFLAGGRGIRKGIEIPRRNIVDIASTLLYSVGLDVPADLEGAVPEACFTPEQLSAQPVRIGALTLPVGEAPQAQEAAATDEDKEKILAQLQMLGYME